jgi:phage terminase large subunit-like protein
LENSLVAFVRAAWPIIDSAPYEHNWHIDAVCEHLQAVAEGRIRKLVINIPPRHSKTLIVSVLFPCWVWARQADVHMPLSGPQVKFLCMSYSEQVTYDAAILARRLVESDWYQARWGKRVSITSDQSAKNKFDTKAGGTRISSSISGTVLGRGGDIRIIDDPIKADEGESEVIREGVISAYEATLRSRVTDPRTTATILIMQRVHQRDLSGYITENEPDFVHLCLPEEYDPRRHCETELGWEDPRTEAGELLWPARFDAEYLAPFRRNAYIWSGQYQQLPSPAGGSIFKTSDWMLYPPEGETFDSRGLPIDPVTGLRKWLEFPQMDYVVASVDTALGEKEANDWTAMTVWGVFKTQTSIGAAAQWSNAHRGMGQAAEGDMIKVVLLWAWQARLPFNELMEKIILTARGKEKRKRPNGESYDAVLGWKADALLIENKANGLSVIQEVVRLCRAEEFAVYAFDPRRNGGGDITARAHAVSHLWPAKMIFAPDRDWASLVIDEMAMFPKAAHDDLTSSSIQAIKYMRDRGMLQLRDEREAELDRLGDYKQARPAQLPYAV